MKVKFLQSYNECYPMVTHYAGKENRRFKLTKRYLPGDIKEYPDNDKTCQWLLESEMAIKIEENGN
jgi:hypothetical protein